MPANGQLDAALARLKAGAGLPPCARASAVTHIDRMHLPCELDTMMQGGMQGNTASPEMTPPLLFGLLFGVVGIQLSAAHGPSPEFPEQFQADTRMLIADNSRPNSRILCFDIPAHKVSHWVQ
eukprot:gene26893-4502_t